MTAKLTSHKGGFLVSERKGNMRAETGTVYGLSPPRPKDEWCSKLSNGCLVEPCSDWDNHQGRCPATTEEQGREVNKHLEQRRKMRSMAYENWIGRPPGEVIKGSPPASLEARCSSVSCGNRGIIYMALDLKPFVPQELRSLSGKEPVIGPCPACGDYTNEVVESK